MGNTIAADFLRQKDCSLPVKSARWTNRSIFSCELFHKNSAEVHEQLAFDHAVIQLSPQSGRKYAQILHAD